MKTKVVFRRFKDANKDVVALFPDEVYDGVGSNLVSTKLCTSYMRLGQHGGADYQYVISDSFPAKLSEYLELKKELEELGYDLNIKQRR
ncbi:MAG: hypothetical protein WC325_12685 [Candidatus Bathyarchaeia archaeon]|jgi:hypothetical protein